MRINKLLAFTALLSPLIFSTAAYGMEEIYAFQWNGSFPRAKLIQGSDGNFYGTTSYGGSNGFGTVFKMSPAGNLSILVAFDGLNGSSPTAGLVQGSNGVLYGTTELGGTNGGFGTIFKVTTNGVFTPVFSFANSNGANPKCDLIQATDGSFYGTTFNGGDNGQGTVFKVTPSGVMTTLTSFVVVTGSNPSAGLVQATDGNFYGTTSAGGTNGTGTIFKMTPGGGLTALYTFSPVNAHSQNNDGAYPKAAIIQASDGSFYGTTSQGGTNSGYSGPGTVFKVTTNGQFTTLVINTNLPGGQINALTEGSDGNFYGTSLSGATLASQGAVFRMSPAGTVTALASFWGTTGAAPQSGLIQASDGNFYGTTSAGGTSGSGTVFKITPAGALTTLNAFVNANGRYPRGLVEGGDGNFYGVTFNDGPKGGGTVFKITTAGVFTPLVAFDWLDLSNTNASAYPQAALVRGRDGNFYGTAFYGGTLFSREGTVFRVTPAGVLTTLAWFVDSSNDHLAEASLVEGSDGSFYGTTSNGGSNNSGTVFKVTTNGVLTRLASLPTGSFPQAGLVEGIDGNFYGTTSGGGTFGRGTVFRVTPAGVLTTWVSFSTAHGSQPAAALVLGKDGNFYGTTPYGGTDNNGTVFKMTPEGVLTTLVSFGSSKGSGPRAALVQGTDGNFYGTTTSYFFINPNPFEIFHGLGTLFRMTPAGVLTTLEYFTPGPSGSFGVIAPNNGTPGRTALVQGSNGNIYGTSYGGGSGGGGNIFRLFTELNVNRTGNQLVLSWSTNVPGFALQSTTNLIPPSAWIDSTNMPVIIGGQFTVTNSNSGTARFYRLKK